MTQNGPELWGRLLEAVGIKGAVVAGGCLRDYYLGVEPKDYDIFVPLASRKALENIEFDLPSELGEVTIIERETDYSKEAVENSLLIGVLEGEIIGCPVNIVSRKPHLKSVTALLESFDFNILRAAWSPETGFVQSAACVRDLEQRTATLGRMDTSQLSRKRFDKFNKRNPGVLTFVDPWQDEFPFP